MLKWTASITILITLVLGIAALSGDHLRYKFTNCYTEHTAIVVDREAHHVRGGTYYRVYFQINDATTTVDRKVSRVDNRYEKTTAYSALRSGMETSVRIHNPNDVQVRWNEGPLDLNESRLPRLWDLFHSCPEHMSQK